MQANINEEKAREMAQKMTTDGLTLEDFLSQMQMMRKMGPLQDMLGFLPGMNKFKDQLKDVDLNGKEIKRVEAIITSMTPQERKNPKLLNGSRRKRIAAGSGMKVQDVNRLIKQFEEAQKSMKKFKGMGGKKRGLPKLPFFGG